MVFPPQNGVDYSLDAFDCRPVTLIYLSPVWYKIAITAITAAVLSFFEEKYIIILDVGLRHKGNMKRASR